MTINDLDTLKAWAHWASKNPLNQDQKEHANTTMKLFSENEELKAALEVMESEYLEEARINGKGSEREAKLIAKVNELEHKLAKAERVVDAARIEVKAGRIESGTIKWAVDEYDKPEA